jgi:hypothetical protein
LAKLVEFVEHNSDVGAQSTMDRLVSNHVEFVHQITMRVMWLVRAVDACTLIFWHCIMVSIAASRMSGFFVTTLLACGVFLPSVLHAFLGLHHPSCRCQH